MSALDALKPSTALVDARPAPSSAVTSEGVAAFSDVLQILSAKSQSFGEPAIAALPPTAGGEDPAPSAVSATAGTRKGHSDAVVAGTSIGTPAPKAQRPSSPDDPAGPILAAMFQAAAASSVMAQRPAAPAAVETSTGQAGAPSDPVPLPKSVPPLTPTSAPPPPMPDQVPLDQAPLEPAPSPTTAPKQASNTPAPTQTTPSRSQVVPPGNLSKATEPFSDAAPPAAAPVKMPASAASAAPVKTQASAASAAPVKTPAPFPPATAPVQTSASSTPPVTRLTQRPNPPTATAFAPVAAPAPPDPGMRPASTAEAAPSAPAEEAAAAEPALSEVSRSETPASAVPLQVVARSASAPASASPPKPKGPAASSGSTAAPASTPPNLAADASATVAPVAGRSGSSADTDDGSSAGGADAGKPSRVDASPAMQPAAPAPEPLPGAAAAAQVAAALATLGQAVASAEASGPASASAASGAVLAASAGASLTGASALSPKGAREMVIKLDPEHLGTVEIKMRLNAGKLDIEIRVANAQTLDILSRDRHVLSAAVEAAGGTQDGLSLRGGADPAQTQPQTGNGPGADGDLSRNPGAFSSHSSSEDGSRGQAGPSDPFDPDIKRDTDNAPLTPHVTRSPDGSLYL